MPVDYCVSAGEHLSQIAEENGYGTIDPIIDAPENAEALAERPDPHQLLAGDLLVLPDQPTRSVVLPIDVSHRVVVKRQRLLLVLRILDHFGEPVAGKSGTLLAQGIQRNVTTDAAGLMQANVPRTTRSASLEIDGMRYELQVGGLSPSSSVDGARARLNNMGFWSGQIGESDVGNETEFRLGVELFQEENGLAVDGVLSEECSAKVVAVHGQ